MHRDTELTYDVEKKDSEWQLHLENANFIEASRVAVDLENQGHKARIIRVERTVVYQTGK